MNLLPQTQNSKEISYSHLAKETDRPVTLPVTVLCMLGTDCALDIRVLYVIATDCTFC
jgi:hypothetical protein